MIGIFVFFGLWILLNILVFSYGIPRIADQAARTICWWAIIIFDALVFLWLLRRLGVFDSLDGMHL